MNLLLVGINHQTAPVATRERVAFAPGDIGSALTALHKAVELDQAVILSTCNRTEIIACGATLQHQSLTSWLAAFHRLAPEEIASYLYVFEGDAAVRQVMRVTSGLDSMVLGEPQITGQVKAAFAEAQAVGMVGSQLHRLFQQTFQVAKAVRSDTDIGSHLISMPSAALKLARMLFTDLTQCRALLIGVGDMIELAAKQFRDAGVNNITLANRTIRNAEPLARSVQADVVSLEQLQEVLPSFDIVVTATASSLPIIGKGMIERALQKRKNAPMFLVDLAVPRDIEPEVATLRDIYAYSLDDLSQIVSENMALRQAAAEDAEAIIETGVLAFANTEKTRIHQDLVVTYRRQLETIKQTELSKALARIQQGTSPETVIETLANQLVQKVAHPPSAALRTFMAEDNASALDIAQQLLGIQHSEEDS
jgi:glutamyl-tRNA reductase